MYFSKLIPFYHAVHRLQRYSRSEVKWTLMGTLGIDQKSRISANDTPCLVENAPRSCKKQRWKIHTTQKAQYVYFAWQSSYKWAPNLVFEITTSYTHQNIFWINVFKHISSSSLLRLLCGWTLHSVSQFLNHTQSVGLFGRGSVRPKAATNTGQHKHKIIGDKHSCHLDGSEPTTPVFKRVKTVRFLDRAATVIGLLYF
jgi:hypothetical protein